MDLPQVFIFDAGWIFFAAWGMVVTALSIFAFGREVLASAGWKKHSSRGSAWQEMSGIAKPCQPSVRRF
jgi:hypothetical protein